MLARETMAGKSFGCRLGQRFSLWRNAGWEMIAFCSLRSYDPQSVCSTKELKRRFFPKPTT